MNDANFSLWGWEGFQPESINRLSEHTLLIRLASDSEISPRCHRCGKESREVHDTSLRRIRDRDLFEFGSGWKCRCAVFAAQIAGLAARNWIG